VRSKCTVIAVCIHSIRGLPNMHLDPEYYAFPVVLDRSQANGIVAAFSRSRR
jgi:hypothetical protein